MMEVTLEPFIGKSVATGRDVTFEQYRIRVDGIDSGIIGFAAGCRPLLHKRFGPIELKEIKDKVTWMMKQPTGDIRQVPEVPIEILKPQQEDDYVDDIDA